MKKLVHQFGIGESVEFLGWIPPEKMSTYYRKACVFVMPSLMEAFGLVFLEAMAQGLPIIGGNVGGTLELIRDGVNGFLVNPGDVSTLGKKIREFILSIDIRRKVIKNGYSTVEKYSRQKMINDTIELYKELI